MRTCSFSEALAHPEDPLPSHLKQVAYNGAESVTTAPERVRVATLLAGLLHDAGKATPWFQDRLKGRTTKKDDRSHHARFGALLAHHLFEEGTFDHPDAEWVRWAVVAAIAKHHGSFSDDLQTLYTTLRFDMDRSKAIRDQLDAFDHDGFTSWLTDQLGELGLDMKVPTFDPDSVLASMKAYSPRLYNPFERRADGFDFLTVFGALVGADKIHAAHPGWQFEPPGIPPSVVGTYKDAAFGPPSSDLNRLRHEIADAVSAMIEEHPGQRLYTLTAPTGSGKTLTGFQAALELKARNDGSRVIYCLPFTSVIDQNSKVITQVLEANEIPTESRSMLAHHHLTDLTYEVDGEYVEDGADLLVETWQSEVVVTTFHQLLHTLFTSRNRNLKRITALTDAVVLLDEVQAIPYEYWASVREMMHLCAQRLNTTFVLMTATMPLILGQDEAIELLPTFTDHYKELSRTKLINRAQEPMTIDELADDLDRRASKDPEDSVIAILNRRKAVRHVFDALSKQGDRQTAMLSTDLTPFDRRRILDQLEPPFTLVTTQLIEAGVDISADTVIRDMAPLDSIIQSAGRCNRNDGPETGTVELIHLVDDNGRPLTNWVYSPFLIDATKRVLDDKTKVEEAAFHELAQAYYNELQDLGQSKDVCSLLAEGAIYHLDDKDQGLRLIQDDYPRQAHFIIQAEDDQTIWDRYIQVHEIKDPFERRAAYRKMRRNFMERVVNFPTREQPTDEVIPVHPEDRAYNPETGLDRNLGEDRYAFI